jgi:hypothetical protein
MHPFYLEKFHMSRYESWLRQAELERLIQAATEYESQRVWALGLGRVLLRLSQRVERFGQPGNASHRQLLHSCK